MSDDTFVLDAINFFGLFNILHELIQWFPLFSLVKLRSDISERVVGTSHQVCPESLVQAWEMPAL
jgi:hypothetical protein